MAVGAFFHAMFTGLAGEIDIIRWSGEAWFADISWSLRPGDLETEANQVFAHLFVSMSCVVCIGGSVRSVRPGFFVSDIWGWGDRVGSLFSPDQTDGLVHLGVYWLVCQVVRWFITLYTFVLCLCGGCGYTVFLCIGTIKHDLLCRKVLYSAKVRGSRHLH